MQLNNQQAFHISIPGFEPYREGGKHEAALVKNVVHGHLKKTLSKSPIPRPRHNRLRQC